MSYMPQNGRDPLTKGDFSEWVEKVFSPFKDNDFHELKEDVSEMKGKQNILCALAVAIFVAVMAVLGTHFIGG